MPHTLTVARAYHRMTSGVECGDLEDVAIAALVRAAGRFDASRGVPFWGYAYRRVRGELTDYIEFRNRRPECQYPLTFEHHHASSGRNPFTVRERSHRGVSKLFSEALATLPARWRLALELRHVEGMKQADICRELGVSPSSNRGWQLQDLAIRRMRRELALRGINKLEDAL